MLLSSANKNNLLYTAREFDFETGLKFNSFRYYNSLVKGFGFQADVTCLLQKTIASIIAQEGMLAGGAVHAFLQFFKFQI